MANDILQLPLTEEAKYEKKILYINIYVTLFFPERTSRKNLLLKQEYLG